MLCIVAIIDCTHEGYRISFKDLVTLYENTTKQTADVLVEDQLRPPLDLVTFGQLQELHKQDVWSKHKCL